MNSHLKSQHKRFYGEYEEAKKEKEKDPAKKRGAQKAAEIVPKKQSKLTEYKATEKWTATHSKSKEIDESILKYICLSCDTLSFTERPGFADILEAACPNYKNKRREFITELMEKKYDERFQMLREEISSQSSISFTTDMWSSKNHDHDFLSLTAHYIHDFERVWKVLGTFPFSDNHTAENICLSLQSIFDEFGISNHCVHLLLRDAAASMKKATEDLGKENFDCFCHKMHLVVTDGIEHKAKAEPFVKSQIEICRNLVGYYHRSTNFRKHLQTLQRLGKAPENSLVQEIKTRWNSTLSMLRRISEQNQLLTLAKNDYEDLILPDFKALDHIIAILNPFDVFTNNLSLRGESISSVLPVYKCLLKKLDPSPNPNNPDYIKSLTDPDYIKNFRRILKNGLIKRMETIERKNFLVISTLLDPKYKNCEMIFNPYERTENTIKLQAEMEQNVAPMVQNVAPDETSTPNITTKQKKTNNLLIDFLSSKNSNNSPVSSSQSKKLKDEIDAFFSINPDPEIDSLKYWKDEQRFPNLKKLVPKYLAPPPSTVESERTFSRLSEIYCPKRANLSDKHAKMQLFLHFNFY